MIPYAGVGVNRYRNAKYGGNSRRGIRWGLRVLERHFRRYGASEGSRLLLLQVAKSLAGGAYRRSARPQFSDYPTGSASFYVSYEDLLLNTPELWPRAQPPSLELVDRLKAEYEALRQIVDERRRARKLPYPDFFDLENGSSLLIYSLVRIRKPETVVETGVANGLSSFFILHALRTNSRGKLFSIDIRPDVGVLLDNDERAEWGLSILPGRFGTEDFRKAIGALPPIGIFVHDSDHSYLWQKMECNQASLRLAPDGLVLSDDMDRSFGFIDYCLEAGLKLAGLIDPPSMFGVALPRSAAASSFQETAAN